jgi:hypothetical protein
MKNWKTSLIGFLGAFWLVAQPIITNGDFDLQRDWKTLIGAAIATAFGLFAKDKNVTGGTVKQEGILGTDRPDDRK